MEKLPLNDPHWIPIWRAIDLRAAQIGDRELAVTDLERAKEGGELRGMRRSRDSGAYEYWLEPSRREFTWFQYSREVLEGPRKPSVRLPTDGWLFYIWKPDYDRLFPALSDDDHSAGSVRADQDDSNSLPQVRPGPKPRGDWPTLVARWLIAVAVDDPKRLQNVAALVAEASLFLDERMKRAPSDNKVLRAKIVELLQDIRR
jgi:hypothetical protein